MAFSLQTSILDLCVLSLLRSKDRYGYSFTQKMKTVMPISESTIYPVLRRLKKEGLLETYDRQYQGRNRKYYRITPAGRQRLKEDEKEWERWKASLDRLLKDTGEEGEEDE
ncbi:PadR family transcriptional regulator [Murdochiella massiliensis]|uniref:PadR family transcriptional regulator n=1 Tax=Murdochiella massiliensis TaxID=1673723 RepID=UPI000836F4E1|nr:PadR family transcriptional regulator [Murdochiella massiliensis]